MPFRVALLSYRSRPHCGGQGVYVRHLSRELVRLGHDVEVLSGPPYPELDEGVRSTALPGLDLYREPDPFRTPRLSEFRSVVDVLEWGLMCTAAFPEPLTFSLRALTHLRRRLGEFDVVHDNQGLGYGLLGLRRAHVPVVATVHHPITVDRRLDLAAATGWRRRLAVRRWYSFTRMQARVSRRLPFIATVSEVSKASVVSEFGVDPAAVRVIPVGVDSEVFRPGPQQARVPGRLVVTASADVPLKGLLPLLEAAAKVRAERAVELVVVGRLKAGGPAEEAIGRLGLGDSVRSVHGLSDVELADLLRSAQVAVVPSLYEGFCLPAVEAMACATPLVSTTAGALPEVLGPPGLTAVQVPPGDVGELAQAIGRLLDDPALRLRLGRAGRQRVLEHFTWQSTATTTAEWYAEAVAAHRPDGRLRGC